MRAALVGADGTVRTRAGERTDVGGGPPGVLRQMQRLVGAVTAGQSAQTIAGIGISAPGPLDTNTGTIFTIPTLPGWDGYPLRDAAQTALGYPVVVENDGIAAAYGEWRHGAGQGLRHLVYVTVSTGIGGGVVVDGRLMHGRLGMGGHVGHFPMMLDGPPCSCGATGCFEVLAAGTALGKAGRAAARTEPESLMARLAAPDAIEAPHVVEAARRGDAAARAIIEREAVYLGLGFTGLIQLYSPERVIMGGGVAAAFDLFAATIHAVIRSRAMPPFRSVTVVPAGLGPNSGLVGAAMLSAERREGEFVAAGLYAGGTRA